VSATNSFPPGIAENFGALSSMINSLIESVIPGSVGAPFFRPGPHISDDRTSLAEARRGEIAVKGADNTSLL
jgi:hypothetical protein